MCITFCHCKGFYYIMRHGNTRFDGQRRLSLPIFSPQHTLSGPSKQGQAMLNDSTSPGIPYETVRPHVQFHTPLINNRYNGADGTGSRDSHREAGIAAEDWVPKSEVCEAQQPKKNPWEEQSILSFG